MMNTKKKRKKEKMNARKCLVSLQMSLPPLLFLGGKFILFLKCYCYDPVGTGFFN